LLKHNVFLKFKKIIKNFKNCNKYNYIDIKSKEDLKKIPIITKEDLKKFNYHDYPKKPKIVWNTSGITGGSSLIAISNKSYDEFLNRTGWYLNNYAHPYLKSDKKLIFNIIDSFSDSYFINQGFSVISSGRSNFEAQEIDLMAQRCEQIKPNILFGSAPFIYDLLRRCSIGNDVEVIAFGGTMFGADFLKTLKKVAPNAKIMETYSATECMCMAWRNPFKEEFFTVVGSGNIFLEIINKHGEILEEGEGVLLLTDFFNESLPFIRYKLGDKVILKKEGKNILVKPIGRIDQLLKIGNDLVPHNEIVQNLISILKHDLFKFEIYHKKNSVNDCIIFYLDDLSKKKEISSYFQHEFEIKLLFRKYKNNIKTTSRGKKIHIIDKRNIKK